MSTFRFQAVAEAFPPAIVPIVLDHEIRRQPTTQRRRLEDHPQINVPAAAAAVVSVAWETPPLPLIPCRLPGRSVDESLPMVTSGVIAGVSFDDGFSGYLLQSVFSTAG